MSVIKIIFNELLHIGNYDCTNCESLWRVLIDEKEYHLKEIVINTNSKTEIIDNKQIIVVSSNNFKIHNQILTIN